MITQLTTELYVPGYLIKDGRTELGVVDSRW